MAASRFARLFVPAVPLAPPDRLVTMNPGSVTWLMIAWFPAAPMALEVNVINPELKAPDDWASTGHLLPGNTLLIVLAVTTETCLADMLVVTGIGTRQAPTGDPFRLYSKALSPKSSAMVK